MAIISCRECGNQVSSEAPTCPGCGITKPGGYYIAVPKRRISFTKIALFLVIAIIVYANVVNSSKKETPPKPPVDFSKALYTENLAPICPQSVFVDMRMGQGLSAFRSAQFSFFGRAEKFSKLGCEVFNAGMRVYGSPMAPPFDEYVNISLAPGGFPTLFTGKVWLTN